MSASLGEMLRRARETLGLSLRDVEGLTGLSSGYLSLLENDKVKQPKPPVLHKLSNAVGVSYGELMKLAGYVPADGDKQGSAIAFKGAEKLKPAQRREVQEFIYFKLRQQELSRHRGGRASEG